MQQAGKILGSGIHGFTMNINKNNSTDIDTFYNLVTTCKNIQLYSCTHNITVNKEEFLKHLKIQENKLAKIYKNYIVLIKSKESFNRELKCICILENIYKSDLIKYTTYSKSEFNNFSYYGCKIDNKYVIISNKCAYSLENAVFTPKKLDQFIKDTLESLVILQKANYMHKDLKLQNIVYCKETNKYKIIDWEQMIYLKYPFKKKQIGVPKTTSMLFLYMLGYPRVLCPINMYMQTKVNGNFATSDIFKYIYQISKDNFNYVLDLGLSKTELFKLYCKTWDSIAIAYVISEICFLNKINFNKYKSFVSKLLNHDQDRYHSAEEALFDFH